MLVHTARYHATIQSLIMRLIRIMRDSRLQSTPFELLKNGILLAYIYPAYSAAQDQALGIDEDQSNPESDRPLPGLEAGTIVTTE